MSAMIKFKTQIGMVTLAVSVIVLLITTSMVFFATKVGVLDLRMAGNEVRYKEAFTIAEAGLDFAIQKFNDQFNSNFNGTAASWTTIITNSQVLSGTSTNGQVAATGQPSFGVLLSQLSSEMLHGNPVYTIQSTGVGADGTATAVLQRKVTMSKILAGSTQSASVMVSGSVGTGGNFNIVANPNAAGIGVSGVPVSIWTQGPSPAGDVTVTGSSATCNAAGFSGSACTSDTLTTASSSGSDIVANDPNFPDIFQYLFGVARIDWQTIYSMAELNQQVVTDCSGLGANSGQKFRLWWVTGDCDISGKIIGSEADPVILVVDDHTLTNIGGNGKLYGIPYLFNNPDNGLSPSARFGGNPTIYGALASDIGGSAFQGSYSVVYDQAALGNLTADTKSANYGMAYIPGSWRDF